MKEEQIKVSGKWEYMLILHLHEAKYLKKLSRYNIYFELWHENMQNTLKDIYGIESEELKQFNSIRFEPVKKGNCDFMLYREMYIKGLEEAIEFLKKGIKKFNSTGRPMDIIPDVRCYLEFTSLPLNDKEKIIKDLEEICSNIDSKSEPQQSWGWEIQVNKLVKQLHKLVSF